jgi:hypothetical protein
MTLEDLMGRIWSGVKEKMSRVAACVSCLPKLFGKYRQLRKNSFSRKAAWFCARNTKF